MLWLGGGGQDTREAVQGHPAQWRHSLTEAQAAWPLVRLCDQNPVASVACQALYTAAESPTPPS